MLWKEQEHRLPRRSHKFFKLTQKKLTQKKIML